MFNFSELLAGPANIASSAAQHSADAIATRHVSQQPDACHRLSYVDGRAEIAVATDRHGSAWHNQGIEIPHGMSGAQARELALPWDYQRDAITTADGYPITSHVCLRRSDTGLPLSVVSESYEVFGNGEMFEFLDSLCETGQAFYESAGALEQGRKTWALLRNPNTITVAPGDDHKPYVAIMNSCDGTRGLRILPTFVRIVCNNTYTAADRTAEGFSIRHTKNMRDRIAVARNALSFVSDATERYSRNMQALVRAEMDRPAAKALFTALMATDTKSRVRISGPETAAEFGQAVAAGDVSQADVSVAYNELRECDRANVDTLLRALNSPKNTVGGVGGSAYSAFQAFTDWADHSRTVRGAKSADDMAERRFASNMVGASHADKVLANQAFTAFAAARN